MARENNKRYHILHSVKRISTACYFCTRDEVLGASKNCVIVLSRVDAICNDVRSEESAGRAPTILNKILNNMHTCALPVTGTEWTINIVAINTE